MTIISNGKVRDYYTTYNKKYLNSLLYYGETYKVVDTIKVLSSGLVDTNEFYILDSYDSTIGVARFKSSAGKISSMSMINRAMNITGEPILSYSADMASATINYEMQLKEVSYVANGIAQAQYNYSARKQLDKSYKELYNNLTTKLLQKLEGYTSKHC